LNIVQPARSDWSIPDGVIYLNHGSFGPSPRVVQEVREEWTRRLERQPMGFFLDEMDPALDESMNAVAQFVGAEARDMVFVDNATVAMNIVAESIELKPGDEILLTDHEYGAVVRIWRRKCDHAGARLVTARLAQVQSEEKPSSAVRAVELTSSQGIVDSLFLAVTERTKMIILSHITSPSAIIFPVAEICRTARERGISVCIDGPHAIAMLDVNLREIDCDYYCASLHKWLSAPFGSGFLYVKRSLQKALQPHVMSWGRSLGGYPERWQDHFNWLGTRDPAPFLSVPAAIEFLERVGIERFRLQTHQLAQLARNRLEQFFGERCWTPDSSDWYGSMIAVPLPYSDFKKRRPNVMHPLQKELRERFRIEVPITQCCDRSLMRVSCHLYNTPEEINYLIDSLRAADTKV
jgi:isopenicillin-N epimerase